jgi:hypothetical protein
MILLPSIPFQIKYIPFKDWKKNPILVAVMLYQLYGENDSLDFKLGWVLLIHHVLKGKIFNRVHILSNNIQQEVKKSQEAPPQDFLGFFFLSLVM